MFKVLRVNKIEIGGNSHKLGNRDETWSWSRDKVFSTKEEAEEYIIEQNYKHSGYELRVFGESDDVIRKRCLEDTSFASYWVCFMDIDKKAMRDLIVSQLIDRKVVIRR